MRAVADPAPTPRAPGGSGAEIGDDGTVTSRIALKATRFLSLLLVALTFGMAFCHVLEIPGKLRLDGAVWLAVQQNLYVAFGVVGAAIELLSILLTWAVALQVRHRRPAFAWTVAAGLCVTAGLVVWFAVVAPMNAALSGWTPETLPADWTRIRDRWEIGHAVHAALFGFGFGALAIALLAETSGNTANPRPLRTRIGSTASGSIAGRA